jgi:hypothetical protein
MMNTIPLEIKYLILEPLNYIDIVRVIKATGVCLDDLYWQRRHKFAFASTLREISAIVYSIESSQTILCTTYISKRVIGDKFNTQCTLNEKLDRVERLIFRSNKEMKELENDNIEDARKYYECEITNELKLCREIVSSYRHADGKRVLHTCIWGPYRMYN